MSMPLVIRDAFGPILKTAGFKKKRGDTWYREGIDVVQVVNLQESPWSRLYFVNLGISIVAISQDPLPRVSRCQFQMRWRNLIPWEQKQLEKLLNLEDGSRSDEERKREIGELLTAYVLPFFDAAKSIADIKTMLKAGTGPRGCWVTAAAQPFLDRTNS